MLTIFNKYPLLGEKLPYISLGNFPTAVDKIDNSKLLPRVSGLWVKRDDQTGSLYGGNKVRKLEFLLGEAKAKGCDSVITFGFAGSNHALATAFYAKSLGMECICMLMPQPISGHVRHNLLLQLKAGSEVHFCGNHPVMLTRSIIQLIAHKKKSGRFPMVIPPGGTTPSGTVGFVNAAFELKEQIEARVLPEPDYIYAALGTAGTAAGLALGLKLAGLKSKVEAVLVVDERWMNKRSYRNVTTEANKFMHRIDPSVPIAEMADDDYIVRNEFFGTEYGLFTEQGQEAVKLMQELSGIHLEGTYTGKTFAAIVADSRSGKLEGKNVLYWNTLSSADHGDIESEMDYRDLPKQFHSIFTDEVQPLDKEIFV
ncbi:MAG: pyridoxal-phosphate dependent enzyme [Firmicutes bacterium]|nr:pyridoxal-phosphate dependent enzyme [Bacillota bacterium]